MGPCLCGDPYCPVCGDPNLDDYCEECGRPIEDHDDGECPVVILPQDEEGI